MRCCFRSVRGATQRRRFVNFYTHGDAMCALEATEQGRPRWRGADAETALTLLEGQELTRGATEDGPWCKNYLHV